MTDIYKKWSPVMDALKITDEKKRKIMAEYAEKHQTSEGVRFTTSFEKSIIPTDNILPYMEKDGMGQKKYQNQ